MGAARALLQHIGTYGTPAEVLFDNGTQYVNELLQQLFVLMGTAHQTITPYSHEENAIVERANKTVLGHLRKLLYDKNVFDEWSLYVPLVQRIINASVHSTTGFAPATMVFGEGMDLDRGLILPHNMEGEGKIPLPEWHRKFAEKHAYIIGKAQALWDKQFGKLDSGVGTLNGLAEFAVGDFVLCSYPEKPPSKLHLRWEGPFQVLHTEDGTCKLKNMVSEKTRDVHVSRLKPFILPEDIQPLDIARHDYQEFVVEKIVAHRGPIRYKSRMEFKVRWLGYAEDQDLWLSWRELLHNRALHVYLLENKMQKLIPREVLKDLVQTASVEKEP